MLVLLCSCFRRCCPLQEVQSNHRVSLSNFCLLSFLLADVFLHTHTHTPLFFSVVMHIRTQLTPPPHPPASSSLAVTAVVVVLLAPDGDLFIGTLGRAGVSLRGRTGGGGGGGVGGQRSGIVSRAEGRGVGGSADSSELTAFRRRRGGGASYDIIRVLHPLQHR